MPDRIVFAVVGLWVTTLIALLTVGQYASDGVVFILFGVMMSSAAFVVATCYGVVRLLRLLALALAGGVCLAAVLQVLPGGVVEVLGGVAAPIAVGVFIAAGERRKRRRQRVPTW